MTARRANRSPPVRRSPIRPPGRRRDHIFRREGEYWTIVYEGILFRLKDSKGLRYLAHLLSRPDEPVPCAALWSITGRNLGEADASAERARLAVTKRIKASVAKIAVLHPGLADHLSTRIRTGYFCLYACSSRGPTAWKF